MSDIPIRTCVEAPTFADWLRRQGYSKHTAESRVSEIERIKKAYPDLDSRIFAGDGNDLLREFEYPLEDYRAGIRPRHKVAMDGNWNTITATLRRTLRLYIAYILDTQPGAEQSFISSLRHRIIDVVENSRPQVKITKTNLNSAYIQPLIYRLQSAFPDIEWKAEAGVKGKAKDKFDLIGVASFGADGKPLALPELLFHKPKESNKTWLVDLQPGMVVVIIEFDNANASQTAKKALSRIALTMEQNIIYISAIYSNDNSKSESGKVEVKKYDGYTNDIINGLNGLYGLEKIHSNVIIY